MDKFAARTTVTAAVSGVFPIRLPSLTIEEVPLAGIIRIQGNAADPAVVKAIEAATGLGLPHDDHYAENGDRILARVGPNEWLLFVGLEQEDAALEALIRAGSDHFITATLISDSRATFAVGGTAAAELMAKGSSLDFHPDVFPVGVQRSTRFAAIPAVIAHVQPDRFLIYLDVSLAPYAVSWLIDAATEFSLAETTGDRPFSAPHPAEERTQLGSRT